MSNHHSNDRKWKFPFISILRYVNHMFSFLFFFDFLFPVCFFWLSLSSGNTDNQHFTIRKQILKKKNVMPITGRSPMSRCWRAQPSIASYTSGGIAVVCSLLRLEFFYKFIVILIFLLIFLWDWNVCCIFTAKRVGFRAVLDCSSG